MPAGVVDVFKNLIRHGKYHNHPERTDPAPSRKEDDIHHAHVPSRARQQAQATATPHPDNHTLKSPVPREIAESIVEEERQAKDKMPSYRGLENYKLLEKMGDGAFSNVYNAVDLTSGKKVAIKVVRKYELNASQRANILKEVQIMRGINHPSIIKLYNFFESPEHYFLILELMEGGELFHQIVKLTYFSENLARHVILQVANGIRYLHEERGVVHRDIKPENILFECIDIVPSKHPVIRPYDEGKEDEGEFLVGIGGGGIGKVKIADFGLSKIVWNEETMTPCGTVGYTAPEIVKDERYSKSVDMWALGCVLYTLLCGFPPFYDESINVLTEKVARGHYTFLSPWWDDIGHSAKDLITHLLCVDSAQRYTIDEFLAHPWCRAAPAPPPPPTPLLHGKDLLSGKPLDSPLLSAARGGREYEGRSPGIATLKEAFDITYAVHRMEEEGARRRKFKGRGGTGERGFLSNLNEDDEDDDIYRSGGEWERNGNTTQLRSQELKEGRAGQRDQGSNLKAPVADRKAHKREGGRKDFELDLQGATLLGRRHRKGAAGVKSPLSNQPLVVSQLDAMQATCINPNPPPSETELSVGSLVNT